MSNKKIEFLKKPTLKETTQFIDNWVQGNTNLSVTIDNKLKRTTIYLPEALHRNLKIKAANKETTMTEIIIEALEKYMI